MSNHLMSVSSTTTWRTSEMRIQTDTVRGEHAAAWVQTVEQSPPDAVERPGPARRRVLFITYNFPPSTRVGAASCHQIARNLPRHGWDPVILSAAERDHGTMSSGTPPIGPVIRTRVLPHPLTIYRRMKLALAPAAEGAPADQERVGEDVSGAAPTRVADAARRIVLGLLAIPDIYIGWLPSAVVSGRHACRRYGIDALVSSGPWWTSHLVGLILAKMTGLPWVAHFRDPWTHAPGWKPKDDVRQRVQAALERLVVTRADAVVCVTQQHSDLLRTLYPGLPPGKFTTIPNGYDEAEWEGVNCDGRRPLAGRREFVITYAGSLYEERNPAPIFRALRQLIDDGDVEADTIRFDFIGWCDTSRGRSLRDIAAEWKLGECLRLDGVLGRVDAHRRMVESGLLLLLAEDRTLLVPAKAYEYLRAGRPVLALAPGEGAVAHLFARTGGAWVLDPADHAGITGAVRSAYLAWANGEAEHLPDPTIVSEFDRARLAGDLAQLLDNLVSCRRV